ncbi:DinB family protein [Flectobacillus sp. DC10W]|jgi:hypothetical protein|uniref:DinB family protein n=1 Tax=Flectobacillus longus TaxID=2984207 RepID=A0ABT6YNG2_9BACT|nr:DinB family protein [Flectobacillus longus]MDI9865142.1 DinB family protein [Flectobacillus longus]
MKELLKSLSHRINLVSAYWQSQSEESLSLKSSPEKWSKKEVLGHLIDSAQNNIRRFVVGQYQSKAQIIYEQNIWVKAADYQTYPSEDLLELWRLLNKHLVRVLANLPEEKYQVLTNWTKEAVPDAYPTLWEVAQDYLCHLDHHLKQLGMRINE